MNKKTKFNSIKKVKKRVITNEDTKVKIDTRKRYLSRGVDTSA